jgi:hypothetical protein
VYNDEMVTAAPGQVGTQLIFSVLRPLILYKVKLSFKAPSDGARQFSGLFLPD